MKAVILAGGYGTRLSEETDVRPKPMVEIGGRPILWHIMKHYSHFGFHEFVILLGYKGNAIKEYFANYFLYNSDVTFDLSSNRMEILTQNCEPWRVTLVDTGLHTLTGGRLLRARSFLEGPFMLTYGDGVADVDLRALLEFHRSRKRLLTMTVTRPEGRFGSVDLEEGGLVRRFVEKPPGESGWINSGYFVCEPGIFDYLKQGDATSFEAEPLESLAHDGQLAAFRHAGFWRCMDTLRDKNHLNGLWDRGVAPWKLWT